MALRWKFLKLKNIMHQDQKIYSKKYIQVGFLISKYERYIANIIYKLYIIYKYIFLNSSYLLKWQIESSKIITEANRQSKLYQTSSIMKQFLMIHLMTSSNKKDRL